ncbi:hypothetical protein MRX96_051141 [Rhipicephalus microplus]
MLKKYISSSLTVGDVCRGGDSTRGFLNVPCLGESLPLLPLPGLDRRCELKGLYASADRAGLVKTSVSAGLLRVGGRLLSCFIDVEGVAFMFFKVVDILRLAFGVLSLASVAVVAEEIKAVLSATPLVMGAWSSGFWRFSDAIDALQLCRILMLPTSEENHWVFPSNSHLGVHVASERAVHLKLPRLAYWPS